MELAKHIADDLLKENAALQSQVAALREVLDEAINLLTSLENDYPSEGSVVRQIQDLRCDKVPKLLSSIPAEED